MNVHILAIDIGNTAMKAAVFNGDIIVQRWRVPTSELSVAILQQMLSAHKITQAVMSSVVPVATTLCRNVLEQHCGDPLLIGTTTSLPIRNAYSSRETLGPDRLANAMGGYATLGAPCMIISAGTAITIDVIDRDRAFRGGAIWAGVEIISRALHEYTAALPLVLPGSPPHAIGDTTQASLESGILYGVAGGVEQIVGRQCEELGYVPPVIWTGGGAETLRAACTVVGNYDADLVLKGLKAIFDHQEHDF